MAFCALVGVVCLGFWLKILPFVSCAISLTFVLDPWYIMISNNFKMWNASPRLWPQLYTKGHIIINHWMLTSHSLISRTVWYFYLALDRYIRVSQHSFWSTTKGWDSLTFGSCSLHHQWLPLCAVAQLGCKVSFCTPNAYYSSRAVTATLQSLWFQLSRFFKIKI